MGYYVKFLSWKKSKPNWKVQYVSYKKEHIDQIKNKDSKKPKKTWDVTKSRWRSLGFYNDMSILEARARAKQLNLIENTKRQEERIKEIEQRNLEIRQRCYIKLPDEFLLEFEKRFVTKTHLSLERSDNKNRALRVWRAAQKVILAIDYEPSDWYYNIHDFYDYFYEKKLSIRYMNEIMKFVNLWGFFFCKKLGRPFFPVPRPGGYERRRIIAAFLEKTKEQKKVSDPITNDKLLKIKNDIRRDLYNWIYLTVWFGLRPKEVDNLHQDDNWKIEELYNGRKVLWIFQTKVIALPEEDRWKPIPILYKEQEEGLEIIKTKQHKRPLIKTMRLHFGKTYIFMVGERHLLI